MMRHNNRSKGDLYRIGKENLENLLVEGDAGKRKLEEAGNTSSETYKTTVANIKQVQEQLTKILYYKPKDQFMTKNFTCCELIERIKEYIGESNWTYEDKYQFLEFLHKAKAAARPRDGRVGFGRLRATSLS